VKSYPNEEFIVRSCKLFCHACKEVLALKKVLLSIISSPKNTSVSRIKQEILNHPLPIISNLRQQILFIHQEELSRIKQEILNQPLPIIFDGTTHVREAFVVVLRSLTDDWELN